MTIIERENRAFQWQPEQPWFYQDVEKVLPWTFSTAEPENGISRFLHFQ